MKRPHNLIACWLALPCVVAAVPQLFALPTLTLATLTPGATATPTPTVTLAHGVLIGTQDTTQSQDRFLGIPFAQVPTGTNRLRAPQSITSNYGTITVTSTGQACPQFPITIASNFTVPAPGVTTSTSPDLIAALLTPAPTSTGASVPEDCLRANVQRPAGTKANAKLPVVFWIWGGSWEIGTIAAYDPHLWMTKAMALNAPFIWVGFNYRLGSFGFLPGAQMAGQTNLGLRDQRAALEWVADNIAAFGGDPDNVTLFGNSGGALSVTDQLLINRGDNTYKGKPLFHRAMMDSGLCFPSYSYDHPKAQRTFDGMATAAGCDPSSPGVVDCLRNLDFQSFLDAQDTLRLPNDVLNLTFSARPDDTDNFFPNSPEVAVAIGEIARVPTITGYQQDEGTFFALPITNLDGNNDTAVVEYLHSIFVDSNPDDIQLLLDTYPNGTEGIIAGCPYNTGLLNEAYSGYKRLCAFIGDWGVTLSRRLYLDETSAYAKTWSYTATYYYGTPILGTFHATDELAIFSGNADPSPVDQILTRYTSFVTKGDPNVLNENGWQIWPQYNSTTRQIISFDKIGTSYLTDDFRDASYQIIKRVLTQFRW